MIIAALVTSIELAMQALTYELYLILGIFISADSDELYHHGSRGSFCSKK